MFAKKGTANVTFWISIPFAKAKLKFEIAEENQLCSVYKEKENSNNYAYT